MKKLSYLFVIISFFYFSNTSFSATIQNKDTFITKIKANQGEAQAQYMLGLMYKDGQGVDQNYVKAVELLSKAANQGYAAAQSNLGVMYANGQGVVQDYFKAVELYTKVANQGDAEAQYMLGLMYANGHGVVQDYFKAKELFKKSCLNKLQAGCDSYASLNKNATHPSL